MIGLRLSIKILEKRRSKLYDVNLGFLYILFNTAEKNLK